MKAMDQRTRQRDGRYANERRCDGCGGRIKLDDYCTDEEVCGDTDGPGFYVCGRTRCPSSSSTLTVEQRRAIYTSQRAINQGGGA